MQKLTIKQIASFLEVRPVRIREKFEQLNLQMDSTELVDEDDVRTLVNSYMTSPRVGERTLSLSKQLLQNIEAGIEDVAPQTVKTKKTMVEKDATFNKRTSKQYSIKQLRKGVRTLVQMFIHALTSSEFKFVALLVAISVQMQHSAVWFHRLSTSDSPSWIIAYGYAFMVDLFILVITLEGKLPIAKTFAVLTFFANVLYFQFWVNFDYTSQAWTNAISSIMVSAIMAYILYAYTEIFVKIQLSE